MSTEKPGQNSISEEAQDLSCGFYFVGFVTFMIVSFGLESIFGIAWDTSFRVGCMLVGLGLATAVCGDHRRERWFVAGMAVATIANVAIFLTPLVERPTSRGELMIFLGPTVIVLLLARLLSYPVRDARSNANRLLLVLSLVTASILYATMVAVELATMERN